jgi:hypothetical protein
VFETTYNLSHTVKFATSIQSKSNTVIDNMFVDNIRINLSSISPIINYLSDSDAQILTIQNIYSTIIHFSLKQRTRLINNETIMNFKTVLKKGTWEFVCINKGPNQVSNSFLCT